MSVTYPPTKRREKRLKPGTLAAYYAKLPHSNPDICLHNELPAQRCDSSYLHHILNAPQYDYKGTEQPSVIQELQTRGYDITTLNFSIMKAATIETRTK